MAEAAALLVDEVFPKQPVRQWVLSFPYPLRFLFANKPEVMTPVLGIVYRVIATHLVKKAGFTRTSAHTGAVTLIQRFGSVRWLASEDLDEDPMSTVLGHSITYRIAVGPNAGRKVMTLQTLPADDPPFGQEAGKVSGFSLHAGVAARADQRDKLERVCRYVSRPAVSEKRLSLTSNALVRYQLKTPYRDGTTQVFFEPLDFLARLAALVPRPRVNLTRFHGVFAPNSQWRAQVTPAKRGRRRRDTGAESEDKTPAQRHAAMSWAQRLKRVFDLVIATCQACGGAVRIIAAIEEPTAIRSILDHLEKTAAMPQAYHLPAARAPPWPLPGLPAPQPHLTSG